MATTAYHNQFIRRSWQEVHNSFSTW